jgi:hypothetical protein
MFSVVAIAETVFPLLESSGHFLAAQSLSIPWAIVLFGIAIGLAITLSPSRRTFEIKRPKDE